MAKKQPQVQPQNKKPVQAAAPAAPSAQGNGDSFVKKNTQWLILAGIALLTFVIYKGSLDNQFTNWDDLGYVLTNPWIKNSTIDGFKKLFSMEALVMGNYHPLTIVTYWYEYSKHGLEPYYYHLHSTIFHILCTFTVFAFARVLTRNITVAAITALLFAVHPMRVESVTWIAGRKDLLYGMFYMLAMVTHIWYVRNQVGKKWLWYVATIVLFATSLMCKSVGVTLPVVLLLVDFYERRKPGVNLIIEKLPLFVLSVTFGLISIYAQKDVGALGTLDVSFKFYERIALGCYALTTYIWKAVLPVGLTNFYPYPLKVNDALPAAFYVYPLLVAAGLFLLVKYGRNNRLVVLCVSFFVINLLLLLQFMPVGGAIMSDRYTYIPYVGIFLLVGSLAAWLIEEKKQSPAVVLGALVAVSLVYGYMTNERNKDWYDSISLWNSAIEKNPESPIGYFYLGQDYYTRFETALTQQDRQRNGDSAFYYFTKSVERKPDYTSPIICIGEYQRSVGLIDDAKSTYLRALSIDDKLESAYLGLGVVYSIRQKFDSAGVAFRKALSLKKYFPEGHSNYANYLDIIGKTDSSLIEYQYAINQNPDAYIPYMNRGRIYLKIGKPAEALKDYDRANYLKPENPDPYYMRAQCYLMMGQKPKAQQEAEEARKRGGQLDPAFLQSLR
ncbi:MAG: phospholipid carrier-dependent glycosyltransferase [Chitinophagaceae bacterium]|nr:phospholipid carrier-dependent glycosyltransferase [Chitinophagaceae bacterium]